MTPNQPLTPKEVGDIWADIRAEKGDQGAAEGDQEKPKPPPAKP